MTEKHRRTDKDATYTTLTDLKVKSIKRPGIYPDRGDERARGLYLQVSKREKEGKRDEALGVSKSWLYRFISPTEIGRKSGKASPTRGLGLGPVDCTSLAEARKRAREARRLVLDGIDPIEAKKETDRAKQEAARARVTFRDAAEEYWAMRAPGWKNKKDPKLWLSSVKKYAYPTLGNRPALEITGADITDTLKPIWTTKAVTARRVKQRVEAVIQWLKDGKPLSQKGHAQKRKHHAALPFAEMPAFMAELRTRDSVSARALEFTILTAARTSEAIEAKWTEFDLKTKTWTIPASRMKAGKQHRVPLSDRAVQILEELPREHGSEFVFVSRSKAKLPLSNMAMLQMVRGLRPGLTVHGMRSAFRDWAGDRTSFPREVIEHCLAHQISDAAEAAYRRSDALQKRRQTMSAWSSYCEGPTQSGDNVVSLKNAM